MPHACPRNKGTAPTKTFPPHVRLVLSIYRGLMRAATPITSRLFQRWGKQNVRWIHSMGIYDTPRPTGPVVWIHGAGLGELRSTLPLIKHLRAFDSSVSIVLTCYDELSFKTFRNKFPDGVHLVFLCIDTPLYTKRFLDHWTPDSACFIGSEVWPTLWCALYCRSIPLVNIGFTMGPKSLHSWKKLGKTLDTLLGFSQGIWMLDRDKAYAWARQRGLVHEKLMPSQKYLIQPYALSVPPSGKSPKNPMEGSGLWWMASCVLMAEEGPLILEVHARLKKIYPDLILVWALRHPLKTPVVPGADQRGFSYGFRSQSLEVSKDWDIYFVDTYGELDQFYLQAPFAVMGDTLHVKGGGHNIIEPIAQGCLPIVGTYSPSAKHLIEDFLPVGAVVQIPPCELFEQVLYFLQHPEEARELAAKGQGVLAQKKQELSDFLDALMPKIIPPSTRHQSAPPSMPHQSSSASPLTHGEK